MHWNVYANVPVDEPAEEEAGAAAAEAEAAPAEAEGAPATVEVPAAAPIASPQARQGRASPHGEGPGYRVHAQMRAPGAELWSPMNDNHSLQWENQTYTRQYYRLQREALKTAAKGGATRVVHEHKMVDNGCFITTVATGVRLPAGWQHRLVFAITNMKAAVTAVEAEYTAGLAITRAGPFNKRFICFYYICLQYH